MIKRVFFDFAQDAEREKTIEFLAELEVQWPEGKEVAQ